MGVQRELSIRKSNGLLKLKRKLQRDIDLVLRQEELLWFQRSREGWITSGDRNTKFYHASIVIRKSAKKIRALQSPNGKWITDPVYLKELVSDYYNKGFFQDSDGFCPLSIPYIHKFPPLSAHQLHRFNQMVTSHEIRQSVFLTPFKALGPDGLHAGFYQHLWHFLKNYVSQFVLDFFQIRILPFGVNDTLLTLIPKVLHPEHISQFRPISLCNVSYKIITKTMANRLKEIMQGVVALN